MRSTFNCFPKLTLELRLKIFGIMVQHPRTVLIDLKSHGSDLIVLEARSKTPAVLLVCKESREEALRIYSRSQQHFSSPQFDRNLYINLDIDTLLFANPSVLATFFNLTCCTIRDQIRSLAFRTGPGSTRYMSDFFLTYDNMEQYVSRCRKLDDFTIVVDRFELLSILEMPYWQDDYLKCWKSSLKSVVKDIEKNDSNWERPEMKVEIWTGWERPDWDTLEELRRSWAVGRGFVFRSQASEVSMASVNDS